MEIRKTEKYIDEEWIPFNFEELKKGDKFRLFEKSGELVIDNKGKSEFISLSDVYKLEPNGNFGINIQD